MHRELFDFDGGNGWLWPLRQRLGELISPNAEAHLRISEVERLWSAKTALREVADLPEIYRQVRAWITERDVVGYRGTRLDDEQRASIQRDGLVPLSPDQREAALHRFLSPHPRWPEMADRLAGSIAEIGNGGAGNRTGQVHLTVSGAGLLGSFNHYLVEGSEFDHHVANSLFGEESHDLNRVRGRGLLYRVRIDGAAAFAAANPFGEMAEPNLVSEMVQSLAWSLATGREDTEALEFDCGMIFYQGIPPDRIMDVTEIPDDVLWENYDHRLR